MNEGWGFTGAMFWAGALMAFTPITLALVVLGIWRYQRKKSAEAEPETTDGAG